MGRGAGGAIAQIDAIVRAEQIACAFEWVPGYLHGPLGAAARATIGAHSSRKRSWRPSSASMPTFVDQVPFVGGPGVRFDGQARFHPRKYLSSLARAAESRGVRIHEHSAAEEFTDAPIA